MTDTTPAAMVRLLINDPLPDNLDDADCVFPDAEIDTFLALEAGVVKLAAAQAIDTIADNEALTSKYIRDHDLTLDGPKVADSLRKRAATLRTQATSEADAADDGFFTLVGPGPVCGPELTERPRC